MMILRPIQKKDLEQVVRFASMADIGLTNLPNDARIFEERIHRSLQSFEKVVEKPENELYFFALEDTSTHAVVGVSAIYATTGGGEPLYFFRKETLIADSHLPQVNQKIPILSPISYVRGPSEVCSLFLHPDFRKHGTGKLLSLGRFFFIANFPERFTNSIFAELRGHIVEGKSPFWDGIGSHFFKTSIKEALDLLKYGKAFIPQFLPKYPLYLDLLPKEVQETIGQTHPQTKAALTMLLNQGFHITDEIDVFDGGPKLTAYKNDIKAIKESKTYEVADIQ